MGVDIGRQSVAWEHALESTKPTACVFITASSARASGYCADSYGGTVEFDLASGSPTERRFDPQGRANALALTTDGATLVSIGGSTPTLSVFDTSGGGAVTRLAAAGQVMADGYNSTGEAIVVAKRPPSARYDFELFDYSVWSPTTDETINAFRRKCKVPDGRDPTPCRAGCQHRSDRAPRCTDQRPHRFGHRSPQRHPHLGRSRRFPHVPRGCGGVGRSDVLRDLRQPNRCAIGADVRPRRSIRSGSRRTRTAPSQPSPDRSTVPRSRGSSTGGRANPSSMGWKVRRRRRSPRRHAADRRGRGAHHAASPRHARADRHYTRRRGQVNMLQIDAAGKTLFATANDEPCLSTTSPAGCASATPSRPRPP